MKVLLISPVIRESESPSYFPLGLGYIAQVLLNEGHHVEVLDINANRWTEEIVERKIKGSTTDVIGISAMLTEYNYVKRLVKTIRKYHPSIKIMLGGGWCDNNPRGPYWESLHSMIAAGAVVTKNVPPHSLVAGVPASVIAKLKSEGDEVKFDLLSKAEK